MRTGNRVLVAAAAALMIMTLAGCGPVRVEVPASSEAATLAVGQTLVVDFGEINSSVGDGWEIVTPPDPAVLGPGEAEYENLSEDGGPGSPSLFSYRFEAVGEGTTTVEFEYRFRGEVPDDPSERQTAAIEITVG